MKTPTDLQIFDKIYNNYYRIYSSYAQHNDLRITKNYVPINIDELASELNVDGDIIFGRLYYHLNKKLSYKQEDGSKVEFFALRIQDEIHCVHFPYLASILANLRDDRKRFNTATMISIVSLGIALLSGAIAILSYINSCGA